MSTYVVDASVAAKWFLDEEYDAQAVSLLSSQNTLHAPDFILLELDHVICKKIRRNEMTEEEGVAIREAMEVFPVLRHPFNSLRDRAFKMACSRRRGIYDSLYLCLAVVLGGKLVTADRRFFDAMADGPLTGNLLWIEDVPNESQNEDL